jgi:hypothetical protein
MLCWPTLLVGQTLQGQVYHDSTGAPVPYASIGVKGKPLGTVANDAGRFWLEPLEQALPTDTVVVSCVGFLLHKRLASEPRQPRATADPGYKGRKVAFSYPLYTTPNTWVAAE